MMVEYVGVIFTGASCIGVKIWNREEKKLRKKIQRGENVGIRALLPYSFCLLLAPAS